MTHDLRQSMAASQQRLQAPSPPPSAAEREREGPAQRRESEKPADRGRRAAWIATPRRGSR
jgi:hypothetical protein